MLIEQFADTGYKKDVVIEQIQTVDQLDRKQLLHQQKRNDNQCLPLSVTSFIWWSVTKSKKYSNKTLAHLTDKSKL